MRSQLVFTSEEIGADYDLSDYRLVWTGLSSLQITDLSSGQTSLLYDGRALAPSISGDTILWNVRSDDNNGEDVWGLKLDDRRPLPLVTGEGSKSYPVVAGDQLFVRKSGKSTEGKVEKTSLSQAFATAPEREKLHKEYLEKSKQKQPVLADKSNSTSSSAANVAAVATLQNQLKGIYAPRDNFMNNNAWRLGNRPSGLDALVQNRTNSYFGTITVQYEQLWSGRGPASLYDDPSRNIYAYAGPYNTSTGIYDDARWGPEVRYAMRTLQGSGVRVIVKINPIRNEDKQPNENGSYTPNMFAYNHVRWASKSWTQHMQIGNEPNLEWRSSCGNCWWWDTAHMFTWEDRTDARFYKAINAWYTNVYYQILSIRDAPNEDPNIRSQLANTTFWSPPMLSIYGDNVFDGYRWDGTRNCCYNYYEYLQQMIRSYRRFSYHIYPNPKDDGYGGYILHNQWFRFPSWLQSWISTYSVNYGPDFYSQITEFGWDGPTMRACQYTQDDIWAAYSNRCNSRDGYNHSFENDIAGFFQNERHNALAVTVWITSGWQEDCGGNCGTDRAGGIDASTGNLKRWLYNYQQQYYP